MPDEVVVELAPGGRDDVLMTCIGALIDLLADLVEPVCSREGRVRSRVLRDKETCLNVRRHAGPESQIFWKRPTGKELV